MVKGGSQPQLALVLRLWIGVNLNFGSEIIGDECELLRVGFIAVRTRKVTWMERYSVQYEGFHTGDY